MSKNRTAASRKATRAQTPAVEPEELAEALEEIARQLAQLPKSHENRARQALTVVLDVLEPHLSADDADEHPDGAALADGLTIRRKRRSHDIPAGHEWIAGVLAAERSDERHIEGREEALLDACVSALQRSRRAGLTSGERAAALSLYEAFAGHGFGKNWQRYLAEELETEHSSRFAASRAGDGLASVVFVPENITGHLEVEIDDERVTLLCPGFSMRLRAHPGRREPGEVEIKPRTPGEILERVRLRVEVAAEIAAPPADFASLAVPLENVARLLQESAPTARSAFVEPVPNELNERLIELALSETALGKGGPKRKVTPASWVKRFARSLENAKKQL